ncbi:uncharacterized protein LOC110463046 [Mizuhopecten yessoensis]|uniref:Integrase core domain-containing protein n=1 Tax=Mizuhopecten yessoensis TaxID=6573 RepID=A0A210PWZ8_MIZYE|nr:uncharacterized protein LOC110463046 [Mizuhopecten yessoensis]OWF41011.1 hypothetical protein KP79_PYT23757 [Mizuhopecten yessoensis]
MNLHRRNNESPLEDIVRVILQELSKTGQNVGYRAMRRRLLTDHDINVTSETVRLALSVLDAEGVHTRSRHVFRRRHYLSKGPNFAIHIDGWDKLKPYGISIHAAIDGFSRRLVWLEACSSNRKTEYIAHFYMNYVREINGVPFIIYADKGTENSIVRDLQYALRWNHTDPFQGLSSFIYGSSLRNTRIERFWRNLRCMCGQTWMDLFKSMTEHGILDTTDDVHLQCIRYCFLQLVSKDLEDVVRHWNEHRVRPSRNADGPFGKPDVLYYQPEVFATKDFKMTLPGNVDGIVQEYCHAPTANGVCDEFQVLADHIIQEHRLLYPPTSRDEALELFCNMILHIDEIDELTYRSCQHV